LCVTILKNFKVLGPKVGDLLALSIGDYGV